VRSTDAFHDWLWIFDVSRTSAADKKRFVMADRYSAAEIAVVADQSAFHRRRMQARSAEIERSLERVFQHESRFSARDLGLVISNSSDSVKNDR